MIRHIVGWNFKENIEDKEAAAKEIKRVAEAMVGKIPGLLELKVIIKPLKTGTVDIILNSLLESEEALAGYQVHPEHINLGTNYVKPVTCNRACFDFVEN